MVQNSLEKRTLLEERIMDRAGFEPTPRGIVPL